MTAREQVLNDIEYQYFTEQLLQIAEDLAPAPLYTIWLSLINTLTEKRENRLFTTWYAKVHFIARAYGVEGDQELEWQSTTRFLRKAQYKGYSQRKNALQAAFKNVVEMLVSFAGKEQVPAELSAVYETLKLPTLTWKNKAEQTLNLLTMNVEEVHKLEPIPNSDPKLKLQQIRLQGFSEEQGRVEVILSDQSYYKSGGSVFRVYLIATEARFLKPYSQIVISHLEHLEDNQWLNTEKSLLITNPDYLVDASSLARCFSQRKSSPYLFFLDRFSFFQGNVHTLRGKVINDMLDAYLEEPDLNFETTFQQALQDNNREMLFVSDEETAQMKSRLDDDFKNLQKAITHLIKDKNRDDDEVQKVKDNYIITSEPSFISNRYGLQGRLDILLEYKDSPKRKDIIELKSGKQPSKNSLPWYNDLVQVACYNLLLDSTFEGRIGTSSVLYSRDGENPLRDCTALDFVMQDAMELRNKIIAIEELIAEDKEQIFSRLYEYVLKVSLPNFKEAEAEHFNKKWRAASELDRKYFTAFVGLITRELMVAKTGSTDLKDISEGFASLWKHSIDEKTAHFSLLHDLNLEKFETEKRIIYLQKGEQTADVTSFRAGDIVIIYPHQNEDKELKPLSYQLLKGVLLDIDEQHIQVKIWNRYVAPAFFEAYPKWVIEANFMEGNYQHLFASMAEFLAAPDN
ncbi:MAG: hypothetical protein JJT94_13230, partial [Bernardetiaceae bacterium]|nr:hypothetical protein [Bernardetiaceae bacterium]